MRPVTYLPLIHLAVTQAYQIAGDYHGDLIARQDGQQSPSSATSLITSTSSTSAIISSTSSTTTSLSTTAQPSSTVGISTSVRPSEVVAVITSSSSTLVPSATTIRGSPAADVLPLQPRISPAVGITGVILLVAGLALALVGIKHQWLHVFLSSSLLAALAVTALVVYVMTPPVSDAVQGAYFVAAFMTGIIFGGLSLIFREITEGLACLLGGFCLAMWLLVLRSGGLIKDQTGRGILIGVFCAVAWALYFPKFTRDHALIFCTAFAGATITVLGIDCFSRAGLKEFWIYIWNLNDNEFPIGTTTYPMSRGIRVEVAGIVILALFGLLSQVKIWKMINKRRNVTDAIQLEDNAHREQAEARIAERVQRYNERYLKLWEAAYSKTGDKDHRVSVHEHALEDLHSSNNPIGLPRRTSRNIGASSSTLVADASYEQRDGRLGFLSSRSKEEMVKPISRSTSPASSRISIPIPRSQGSTEQLVYSPVKAQRRSTRNSLVPDVMPLPFKVPSRPSSRIFSSRRTSARDSQLLHVSNADSVNVDRRISTVSDTKNQNRSSQHSVPQTAASSIAATCNDVADMDSLSQHRLSYLQISAVGSRVSSAIGSSGNRKSFVENPVDEDDDEIVRPPVENLGRSLSHELKEPSQDARLSTSDINPLPTESSTAVGTQVVQELTTGALSAHLESSVSKVTTTYRTNEWAKHVTDAEKPVDADVQSTSPGTRVDPVFAQEAAKPVDVDALSSRPTSAIVGTTMSRTPSRAHMNNDVPRTDPRLVRPPSTVVEKGEYPTAPLKATVPLSRRSSRLSLHSYDTPATSFPVRPMVDPIEVYQPTRLPSALPAISGSQHFPFASSRPDFHATAPLDIANPAPLRARTSEISLATAAEGTFNNQNTTRVRSRPQSSAQAVERIPSYIPLVQGSQWASNDISRPATAMGNSQPTRTASVSERPRTAGRSSLIYDSHQPKGYHNVDPERQAALQAQWRQSLQNSFIHGPSPFITPDAAHATMMNERRQTEWHQQQEQAERAGRQSAIDMAMRSGQMQSAHRDALRRMQARAQSDAGK